MSQLSHPLPNKWGLLGLLALGIAIRAATSLHPYSGESTPPIYGDFEAQRHWMEIALHVPPSDWYRNTSQNDLSYWGLDYPPLSAYTSYLFGKVLQYVDSDAVALHTSRGYQTPKSRAAMRATVLLVDLVLFFPALLLLSNNLYTRHITHQPQTTANSIFLQLVFVITSPSLIMIDHAHFQYNNFSLALFLVSLNYFFDENHSMGAVFFCAAVYFKQMSLYYVFAVAAYLFTKMVHKFKNNSPLIALRFAADILLAISATTFIVFFPWLTEKDLALGMLQRLFPVERGLYEDKVANLWCSISVLVKLNVLLPQHTLLKFCAAATVLASLPFCIAVFLKPSPLRLLLSASGCSLAAYLFSYQVHEKQILIPFLPLALLFPMYPTLSTWMSLTAAFSLFPLLLRELSKIAYVATIILHLSVLFLVNKQLRIVRYSYQARVVGALLTLVVCCLNLALNFGKPPTRAPDLFVLLNTMHACAHLCAIYMVLMYQTFIS